MIRVPTSRIGQFVFFAVLEAFSFAIICACTRAQALALYGWTGVTSFIFGLQSFVQAKIMVEDANARTWSAGAGMIIGGVAGDVASVWITKHLFGA